MTVNYKSDQVENALQKYNSAGSSRRSFNINYKKLIKKRIPILTWVPQYTWAKLASDLLAGFTVGLTEIPQGIAYATVAGLPAQYGLYSGFMGCFMYFIFGATKDVNIGPTAIMALMMQTHVSDLGIDMAILMCFLSGCIILALGLLQLGFLIEFFSYPVIAGFTCAAALNIASTQINSFLGIARKANEFLEAIEQFVNHVGETQKWDITLGICTMAFLFFAKEIRRYGSLKTRPEWSQSRNIVAKCIFLFSISRNAIAVLVGSVIAYGLTENGETPFKITGKVDGGLPSFSLPPFSTNFNGTHYTFTDMASNFGGIIAFCPLIALLEHMAIAKAFTKGKTMDATQEMLALGISNILGSFFGSMPITGSFTRTAVNNASGVKTTFAGVITGAMVLLALGFLTQVFTYIPKATLAAVVMVAMFYLFEFEAFIILYRTKKLDLLLLITTFAFCLFLSLEYGILIGIAINITFVLYANARPKLDIGKEKLSSGEVYLVQPRTALHYTAAEHLRDQVLRECTALKLTVVINGKRLGNIDATVAKTISDLVEELKIRQQSIILWNFKKNVAEICLGINKDIAQYFQDSDSIDELAIDTPETETVVESINTIQ